MRVRAAFMVGRLLAALGAGIATAALVIYLVSFAVTDPCELPDCDDSGRRHPVILAIGLAPIALVVGAFGVALIHDTYRKL